MKLKKLFLCFTLLLSIATIPTLGASTFNPHRDYFTYTHGHGNVTIDFSDHSHNKNKCKYDLDDVHMYQIKGDGADVNNGESDDVLVPVRKMSSHSITWQIKHSDYYYITLTDEDGKSAFGSDYVSCYLWFNTNEDARMKLDINEII